MGSENGKQSLIVLIIAGLFLICISNTSLSLLYGRIYHYCIPTVGPVSACLQHQVEYNSLSLITL
jgi:hypothetical protein